MPLPVLPIENEASEKPFVPEVPLSSPEVGEAVNRIVETGDSPKKDSSGDTPLAPILPVQTPPKVVDLTDTKEVEDPIKNPGDTTTKQADELEEEFIEGVEKEDEKVTEIV